MRLSKCLCLRSWVTPGELRELALGLLLLVTCLSISLRNEPRSGSARSRARTRGLLRDAAIDFALEFSEASLVLIR